MNDRFLYMLRETPDPDFVQELRHRILPEPLSEPQPAWVTNWRWALAGLAASIILLASLFTFSPGARALLQTATVEIAGRIYTILDAYPDFPNLETRESEPEVVTVEEALASSPYPIHLPTYAPAGYTLRNDHVLKHAPLPDHPASDVYTFVWRGPENNLSLLTCGACSWEQGEAVAPGAVEEVTLANGRPAVLVRGGWYWNERRWRSDIVTVLEWRQEDVLYRLLAPGDFPVDELIRMASSTFDESGDTKTPSSP